VRRRLFNLAAAVSLVLCVATAALWVRSYQSQGWVKWKRCGSSHCYGLLFGSYPGRLAIEIEWQAADARPLQRWGAIRPPMSAEPGYRSWSGDTPASTDTYDTYAMTLPQRPDLRQFAGIAWYADHSYTSSWNLLVPHRYVMLAAAALPLHWLWLACQATRRVRGNACVVCGYDLRATPDRCPECGAVPKGASTSSA
jgi:hypothetical protein